MTVFKDDRGKSWFDIFPVEGQVNFSIAYPGTIKAFHKHKVQTDYFFILEGDIRLVTVIAEENLDHSKYEVISAPEIHYLSEGDTLEVKPNTWHGYQVLGNKPAKILYFTTKKYISKKPDEQRTNWDLFYNWEIEKK